MELPLNSDIVHFILILVIVKINKMEAFGNDYYMSTPMKSSRKKSICSSSKSRSNSKRKGLQLDDLDISKNS